MMPRSDQFRVRPPKSGFVIVAIMIISGSALFITAALIVTAQADAAQATGAGAVEQSRALARSGIEAVIEELDRFKKDLSETGRNARQVSRSLDQLRKHRPLSEEMPLEGGGSLLVDLCHDTSPDVRSMAVRVPQGGAFPGRPSGSRNVSGSAGTCVSAATRSSAAGSDIR